MPNRGSRAGRGRGQERQQINSTTQAEFIAQRLLEEGEHLRKRMAPRHEAGRVTIRRFSWEEVS